MHELVQGCARGLNGVRVFCATTGLSDVHGGVHCTHSGECGGASHEARARRRAPKSARGVVERRTDVTVGPCHDSQPVGSARVRRTCWWDVPVVAWVHVLGAFESMQLHRWGWRHVGWSAVTRLLAVVMCTIPRCQRRCINQAWDAPAHHNDRALH